MKSARNRLLELLHHQKHHKSYKKRTQLFVEIILQLEEENHFPNNDGKACFISIFVKEPIRIESLCLRMHDSLLLF